ncbi:MAG TPA: hypothetical protein VNV43_01895, partial [Candidatus Acidoferrales bacterium]|nr:hypothetical protein [Candidatus Acidoferrales bacterium]
MKLLRRFILAGIVFWLQPVHAQSALQLIPSGSVPNTGTFWLVLPGMHSSYLVAPCPPVSVFNDSPYDVYYLADGMYLVDNTSETGGLNTNELNSASDLVLDVIAESVAGMNAQAEMASPMTGFSMMSSSLSSAYAYGNPVYLTNMLAHFALDGSVTASFRIAGGTNFVPYDILTATNLLTPVGSWDWLGIGYTSNNYTFYEQPTNMAFYILAKPSKTMVAGIGNDSTNQCDVPYGLTNVIQVAAGSEQSLALKADGTVVAWGDNSFGEGVVPTNLFGVAMISAGYYENYALLTNGTITAWGMGSYLGYNLAPPSLTNVTVIAAGALHALALCSNGTVVAWGYNGTGETNVPAGLTDVTAIAAGGSHSLAVSNGYVVAWGNDSNGQTRVPAGLSNVVDVAAGPYHSLALLQNGTVATWGDDTNGETDVPAGLSNVVAIAAGGGFRSGDPDNYVAYSMALKGDGTVVVWGNDDPNTLFGGLNNVIGIAAGNFHALALRTGPRTPVITEEPIDQYQLTNGTVTFNSRGAGLYGVTYQWQINGMSISGATNTTLTVTNVQSTNAGTYTVTVTDNGGMGSIVSSNANLYLLTPPVVFSQSPLSTNLFYLLSNTVALDVSASPPGQGNGFPLSYHWQFDGTNIPGATSSNYNFTAINSGMYSLIVTNVMGSVTDTWQLAVLYPGAVFAWGSTSNGELNTPFALTNVISLAAGEAHGVVALDSGSVTNWGSYWTGTSFVPVASSPTLTNA